MNIKPGFQTTEFLGVVIAQLVALLVLFKVVPMEQALTIQSELVQTLSALVQAATAIGAVILAVKPLLAYIKSRTELKRAALGATPVVNTATTGSA